MSENTTMPSSAKSSLSSETISSWKPFIDEANTFLDKTQEHALQGLNPGGYYHAIWTRDASFILRDWFLSGNVHGALQQLYIIWCHQIDPSRKEKEKIVYGRGSPEMNFKPVTATDKVIDESLAGSLSTTIYQAGYLEVYGKNPDIDSTALMVSTTSWILSHILDETERKTRNTNAKNGVHSSQDTLSQPNKKQQRQQQPQSDIQVPSLSQSTMKSISANPMRMTDWVIPRLVKAIDYLERRDKDNDGLLEQNHNEDWMDTGLRTGKIVYSQACWILALKNLSSLLTKLASQQIESDNDGLDKNYCQKQASRMTDLMDKTIMAVEKILWSENDGCYIDIQETHHIGGPYRTLTQDVSLYSIAITENTGNDNLRIGRRAEKQQQPQKIHVTHKTLHDRSISSLASIKSRCWKYDWPMDTEVLLKTTGPWVLKPHQYHNETFWPWITGIEMLARSRFDQVDECKRLLSTLASEGRPHTRAFFEWINPITRKGDGAYPFRTGISGIRIALSDILENIKSRSG